MGLLESLKEKIKKEINNVLNLETKKTEEKTESKRKLIYDETIDVTYTNTEGRQRIIKKLYNEENEFYSADETEDRLIGCEVDIEDGNMMSGKKCIKVVVTNDKGFKDELGYLPDEYDEPLHQAAQRANSGYTVDLYATKEEKEYKLKVRIKFFEL